MKLEASVSGSWFGIAERYSLICGYSIFPPDIACRPAKTSSSSVLPEPAAPLIIRCSPQCRLKFIVLKNGTDAARTLTLFSVITALLKAMVNLVCSGLDALTARLIAGPVYLNHAQRFNIAKFYQFIHDLTHCLLRNE